MKDQSYLTLKWGAIKSYCFPDNEKADTLLNEYNEIDCNTPSGVGVSQRQKEIICQLIDLSEKETVYIHWGSIEASKDEAKKYVIDYDNL